MSDSLQPHGLQHAIVHCQLPTSTQTHVHWVSDAIQPSHPPSSPSPPTFNLSQHQGLSNESVLRSRWPKYWSFSFSICPSNEYPGLISFRMDWLNLLAVLGTLKNLLQNHSSKASVLWCSAFSIVQLSHPDMPTGKIIKLTWRTFVGQPPRNTLLSLFQWSTLLVYFQLLASSDVFIYSLNCGFPQV